MENYTTVLDNVLSFVFTIVNDDNLRYIVLKYSTINYDADRSSKSEAIQTHSFYPTGKVIRDATLELGNLNKEQAFGKINYIAGLLKEIDELDLNPAVPELSFENFVIKCTNIEFNYIGPYSTYLNQYLITPNLIDDIKDEIISRIEIIKKIETGLKRTFATESIPPVSTTIDERSEQRFYRALEQKLLPGELTFSQWNRINLIAANEVNTSADDSGSNKINRVDLSLESILNDSGKKIIDNLKSTYKNASAGRFYGMLYGLQELKCLNYNIGPHESYSYEYLTKIINHTFPGSPKRQSIFPSPDRKNNPKEKEILVIKAFLS